MSLLNYPADATPEEVEAYRLGKLESRIQIQRLSARIIECEIALSRIKKATTIRDTFEISATTLARIGAGK